MAGKHRQLRPYRTQINGTHLNRWRTVQAESPIDAAFVAFRTARPTPPLPCLVYVEAPNVRAYDNGQPRLVLSFRIEQGTQGDDKGGESSKESIDG